MLTREQIMQLPNFSRFDKLFVQARADFFGSLSFDWRRLKAQAVQESGLDPDARSRCGAKGLMQLMPETDKWIDDDVDAYEPEGNVMDGTALMAYLMGIAVNVPRATGGVKALGHCRLFMDIPWDERWRFALASYNAGQGNINRARLACNKAGGKCSEWAGVAPYLGPITGASNTQETVNYVDRVVTYARFLCIGEAP